MEVNRQWGNMLLFPRRHVTLLALTQEGDSSQPKGIREESLRLDWKFLMLSIGLILYREYQEMTEIIHYECAKWMVVDTGVMKSPRAKTYISPCQVLREILWFPSELPRYKFFIT